MAAVRRLFGLGADYVVTGSIALDAEVLADTSAGVERAGLQAIVDHELGHVVGLHCDAGGEWGGGTLTAPGCRAAPPGRPGRAGR